MKKRLATALTVLATAAWFYFQPPGESIISVGIGSPFEQVVQASTFPVLASSDIPTDDNEGFGTTWVKNPAVIIKFDDSQYGFSLPPTTFAAVGYMQNRVDTIATSPMLRKLSFDEAVDVAAFLQHQFQSRGWQLDDGTSWFDLTMEGRKRLHDRLRRQDKGYSQEASLVASTKYSMTFRMRCASRCDSRIGLDRYLIDIGIGRDFGYEIQKRKQQEQFDRTESAGIR